MYLFIGTERMAVKFLLLTGVSLWYPSAVQSKTDADVKMRRGICRQALNGFMASHLVLSLHWQRSDWYDQEEVAALGW